MRLFFIFALFIYLQSRLYGVDATIKVEKDVDQRAKVTVIDCSGLSSINRKVFKLFQSDFKISAHFLPSKKYLKGDFDSSPALDENSFGGDYILKYRVTPSTDRVELSIRLYKSQNSQKVKLLEKNYSIKSLGRYPFLVHQAVIDINDKLGFESIKWLKRYIVYSEYVGKRESIIGIADYTFTYKKGVITGGLNIFPIWGDRGQRSIYYTSFDTKMPTLYRLNLRSGKVNRITSSEGMLICSDVSEDGKKLLLTMAPNSQPDIYLYDLNSNSSRRLTTFSGIDVGGKWADSQNSIVFVSNRLGYANIFKKSLKSGLVETLVFHSKNSDSCDASNDKVVYSSKETSDNFGKSFNLYLTTTRATTPRPLTSGGMNQFPRFSPDGKTVMYIKRDRSGNLVGYINLVTNVSMLFPIGINRVQSIDW